MTKKYIKAVLRGHAFAVPAERIAEIMSESVISPVPFAPPRVYGIMYYDGNMISVIDTFGERSQLAKIQLVCKWEQQTVAYLADSVEGGIELTDEEITELKGNTPLDDEPELLRL